ncbi:MAG: CHRD domain-containing protein [Gemmatimonadetes bacterium]|nr:CHRD domain-containing protein [Gemmatimonadota bacterium]
MASRTLLSHGSPFPAVLRTGCPGARTRRKAADLVARLVLLALPIAWGCGGADAPGTAQGGVGTAGGGSTEPGESRPAYYATLDRMPVDFNTAGTIAGSGWVGGEVVDGRLQVEGRFEGLLSAATEAHVHRARPGLRGPPVATLEVEAEGDGRGGALQGSVTLDASLEDALLSGELYIQVHSESNPEGVLRGWLGVS